MRKEEWRPVKGFEGMYEVSSHGRARSLDREITISLKSTAYRRKAKGRILKQKIDRYGYPAVELNNLKPTYSTIHRLVAAEFVTGYFPGAHVNHKNLDKNCNNPNNLEWVTNLDNQRHANAAGVRSGTNNGMSKLSDSKVMKIKKLLSNGLNTVEIGKIFDVSDVTISLIRRGKTWKHI